MIVGVGVDILEIERLRKTLARRGDHFVRRVYTLTEQEYCRARHDPAPHYAVRFAAKEAVFKALGTGWAKGVSWLDVEVARRAQEAPRIRLRGKAEEISLSLGCRSIHLSLSHSEENAVAVVILEG